MVFGYFLHVRRNTEPKSKHGSVHHSCVYYGISVAHSLKIFTLRSRSARTGS